MSDIRLCQAHKISLGLMATRKINSRVSCLPNAILRFRLKDMRKIGRCLKDMYSFLLYQIDWLLGDQCYDSIEQSFLLHGKLTTIFFRTTRN